jgi:hypothetical protein
MEPVSRPEWASPLAVSVHARSFYSALPGQPARDVLHALCGDPRLLLFLEKHPLGRLEFSGRVPRANWLGFYQPQSRDLVVNTVRSAETYGKDFYPPDLLSVSSAGSGPVEAMRRSLYHELGHHILESVPYPALDEIAALAGTLDFGAFQRLFHEAVAVCGPDSDEMEMFCPFTKPEGWRDWMVQELQKAPSRRVA